MATTRASFEEWRQVAHEVLVIGPVRYGSNNPFIGYTDFMYNFPERTIMTTFLQVTQIEAKRREIERLQNLLANQSKWVEFAQSSGSERWIKIPDDMTQAVRETVCKLTILKIITLLDECTELGVEDVGDGKEKLAAFMKELVTKPS